jgi:hypothetical protein
MLRDAMMDFGVGVGPLRDGTVQHTIPIGTPRTNVIC